MLFEHYMHSDACSFKYARGKPAASGREFHKNDEIVLFLGGEAQFISKNIQLFLKPGTMVLIPREHFHQFVVKDGDQYLRSIIGFSPKEALYSLVREVMEDVRVIPSPSTHLVSVFHALMRASEQGISESEQDMMLESAVTQLLLELKLSAKESIHENITVSDLTLHALALIDEHFSDALSLQSLARMLNVSASLLSHRFKSELNISVYRYIAKKRLSEVRQRVERGESLSSAALSCGFGDYSGFYRLYKKQYGTSPSCGSRADDKKKSV